MVSKIIVNGETAMVSTGGNVDFIDTTTSQTNISTLPYSIEISPNQVRSDVEVGKTYTGLVTMQNGEMAIAEGECTAIYEDYGIVKFEILSYKNTTGAALIPSPPTSKLEHSIPYSYTRMNGENRRTSFNWNKLSDTPFYILVDPDGSGSIYKNATITLTGKNSVTTSVLKDGAESYILWQHREDEESPYLCYLGRYTVQSFVISSNTVTLTRSDPLIPLSKEESEGPCIDFSAGMGSVGDVYDMIGKTITLDGLTLPEGVAVTGAKRTGLFRDDQATMMLLTGTIGDISEWGDAPFTVEKCVPLMTTGVAVYNYAADNNARFLNGYKQNGQSAVGNRWSRLGGKALYICVDSDTESTYMNEQVEVDVDDAVIQAFFNDNELYILWLHRDSADAEYQFYLGHYRRTSGTYTDHVTATRLSPLVPLSASPQASDGVFIQIIFDRFDYQKTYTVSAGDETYTGTVPADLSVLLRVKQPSTAYQISIDTRSKTLVSGQEFGDVATVNFTGYRVFFVDPSRTENRFGGGNVQWGDDVLNSTSLRYDEDYKVYYCSIPQQGKVHVTFQREMSSGDFEYVNFDVFVHDRETTVVIPVGPSFATMSQVNAAIDEAISGAINASY